MTTWTRSIVLLTAAIVQERHTTEVLDTTQEMVVRRCVYDGSPKVVADASVGFQAQLIIPEALSGLYRQRPGAVLELLLRIIDGGNPNDSALAAGYAMSLQKGPAVGVICVDVFDKDTYDKLDKAWETTPRKHWIAKIKNAREREKGQPPPSASPKAITKDKEKDRHRPQ
jgi:hypothetical protein